MSNPEKSIHRPFGGRGILDLSLCRARVDRGGSDGYGNCSHDNQGIV
jgi:hypothetical protein